MSGLPANIGLVALGARIIERQVTLQRNMWGIDQMASVEPQGILKLASHIRSLDAVRGGGARRDYDLELPVRDRLRGPIETSHV